MTLSLYIYIISYISLQNYLSVQYVTRMWISPAVLATESSFKWPQQWYCSGQQCQCQQRWLSWSGKFKGLSYRQESYSKHWFILVLMWILQRLRVKYTDPQTTRWARKINQSAETLIQDWRLASGTRDRQHKARKHNDLSHLWPPCIEGKQTFKGKQNQLQTIVKPFREKTYCVGRHGKRDKFGHRLKIIRNAKASSPILLTPRDPQTETQVEIIGKQARYKIQSVSKRNRREWTSI